MRKKRFRNKIMIDEERIKGVIFKIATSKEEIEQASLLLYESYLKQGYIKESEQKKHQTPYHQRGKSIVYIAKKDERVISTLTLFKDEDMGLPMDAIYATELDMLRKERNAIGEVGSLATHQSYRTANQTLMMYLTTLLYHHALIYLKLDTFVISVNPRHALFYESVYGYVKIGDLKYYEMVRGHPAYAYMLDLLTYKDNMYRIYHGAPENRNIYRLMFEKETPQILYPSKENCIDAKLCR